MQKNNILIIDDDKLITILLNDLLKDDYNTFVLNEVNLNINEFILENDISLVLLDIEMPLKNGFEVAKEIKKNKNTKKIPIIFLTVNTDESFVLSAFENDADDYVKKPFNKKELKARIKTHVSNYNYLKKIKKQQEIIYTQAMNIGMNDMLIKISHHWRQPLSIVSLSAQTLIFENDMNVLEKENINKLSNDIIDTVAKLSESINFFSNMYSYKSNIREINIYEEFQNILVSLNEFFLDKSINIKLINNLNNEEMIFIDINAIKNILMNIISNSSEAYSNINSAKKDILIDISYESDYLKIDVIDYAGGIKQEDLHKIFNAYYSTKENLNGTGLGLFICKNIVSNELNGNIEANNININNENGLKITIKIPKSNKSL